MIITTTGFALKYYKLEAVPVYQQQSEDLPLYFNHVNNMSYDKCLALFPNIINDVYHSQTGTFYFSCSCIMLKTVSSFMFVTVQYSLQQRATVIKKELVV